MTIANHIMALICILATHEPCEKSHQYPPLTPTNIDPTLFPTNVGYPGATPTGAEAGIVATAPSYPMHSGAPHLLGPTEQMRLGVINTSFDVFRYWGNLRYDLPGKHSQIMMVIPPQSLVLRSFPNLWSRYQPRRSGWVHSHGFAPAAPPWSAISYYVV